MDTMKKTDTGTKATHVRRHFADTCPALGNCTTFDHTCTRTPTECPCGAVATRQWEGEPLCTFCYHTEQYWATQGS